MGAGGYVISLMLSHTADHPPFPGQTIEVDRVELSATARDRGPSGINPDDN